VKPYGCWNKPSSEGYWARDGLVEGKAKTSKGEPVAAYRMVWVENRMSRDCRYDKKKIDERCEGCNQ